MRPRSGLRRHRAGGRQRAVGRHRTRKRRSTDGGPPSAGCPRSGGRQPQHVLHDATALRWWSISVSSARLSDQSTAAWIAVLRWRRHPSIACLRRRLQPPLRRGWAAGVANRGYGRSASGAAMRQYSAYFLRDHRLDSTGCGRVVPIPRLSRIPQRVSRAVAAQDLQA